MRHLALAALMATTIAAGPALSEGLDELPPDQQKLFDLVDPQVPLGPSAYRDFVAKNPPPWKIGYSSTYAGNTWRAAVLDEFTNVLLPKYKEAGLVSELVVTQSDLNDATQIQQIRQMVDSGVDAIIICCSNITALNQTIEYAHSKGVPVFSFSGYVTSPYAITASENNMQGGYTAGKWLAEEIGGKGNVLMVSGVPGFASSDSFDEGAKKAIAEYPDISIIGSVAGAWTDQVAQVEVQKFMATNPAPIAGILVQSMAENGVLNAVLQSGRELMPIVMGGQKSASCYWRNNPDFVSAGIHFWPPRADARHVWDVMMRTLQGQGPKIQSMLRPAIMYSIDDVRAAIPEDCDRNSTEVMETNGDDWWPAKVADSYFLRPHDPLTWKPAP